MAIDFAAIATTALDSIQSLLDDWLPGGRVSGHDYIVRNPTRDDRRPGSFQVSLQDGSWIDFATEDKGGDLIALYAYLHGCSQGEAARLVADAIGMAVPVGPRPPPAPRPRTALARSGTDPAPLPWRALVPVPDDAPPLMADRVHTQNLYRPTKGSAAPHRPQTVWTYRDAAGRLLGYVIRLAAADGGKVTLPVTYCEEQGSGSRRWCLQAFPAKRPLFGLPWLAKYPEAAVLVVEGEKAAMAANRLLGGPDLVAITSPGGSKSARKADWSALHGRRVIIWPDADPAGLSYACQVAKLVEEAGAIAVRAVDGIALARALGLPSLPKGHDVADIDPATAPRDALRELINQAPPASALAASQRLLDPQDPLTTAELLLAEHWTHEGYRTLHRHRDAWHHWNGTATEELTQARMRAIAYEFCKPAMTVNPQTGAIEPFKPNAYKISNVLDALAARCQLEAETEPCWLDHSGTVTTDGYPPPADIIAFRNGLLSISEWIANPDDPAKALRPHTPAWFSRQVLPHDFDPAAECPIWEAFVEHCAHGDETWIAALAMWFGYNLIADTSRQRMAMLVGPPRAGKGITARVLRAVLGEQNVVAPKISSLADRFGLWPLVGKLAAIAYDVRIGRSTDAIAIVETILSITGEDPQTVDRKNLAPITVRLPTRLTFVGNELLNLPDPSGALSARLLVFPFTISHQDAEDETLEPRIMAELPGIANWALIGLRMLRQHGKLLAPQSGQEQKEEFVRLASPVKGWVEDRVEVGPGLGPTESDLLYDDWKDWCEDQGREPGSKASFGAKLRSAIPLIKRIRRGSRGAQSYCYTGLRLLPRPGDRSVRQEVWR